MSHLRVQGITAGYGKQNVIENISFDLESGCLMGIIGANGSGKTTLLKALCGILPHEGSCTLDGATLVVSSVVSLTGLISFVGLLAPHGARLLTKNNRIGTMFLSGLLGGILLCGADILARSVAATELPVSIFTSILGAPFLIFLIVRGRKQL